VVISPCVVLKGKTIIGEGSFIGAFSLLNDFECEPHAILDPYSKLGPDRREEEYCA